MRKVIDYEKGRELGIWNSRSTQHRLRQTPDFPKPIMIGGRVVFYEDELLIWLENRPRREVSVKTVAAPVVSTETSTVIGRAA